MIRALLLLALAPLAAQPAPAETAPASVTVYAGTQVRLATTKDLTSKKAHKGDQVELVTVEDVYVNNVLVVPKGSPALGTIAMAQDTGAFGQSGKLRIEPLYVKVGNEILRLTGDFSKKGTMTAPAAVGLAVLTPGLTGRSAKIPAGTVINASVLNEKVMAAVPAP